MSKSKNAFVKLENGTIKEASIPATAKVNEEIMLPVKGQPGKFVKVTVISIVGEENSSTPPTPAAKSPNKDKATPKPLYKRFWVWALVLLVVFYISVTVVGRKLRTEQEKNNPTPTKKVDEKKARPELPPERVFKGYE